MKFLDRHKILAIKIAFVLLAMVPLSACHHALPQEEKAVRAELREALRAHEYEKAAGLARRVAQSAPQDNGAWERLIRAQLGLRDFAGAKQTLDAWHRAIRHPSSKIDEYAGDLALAENDSARAMEFWSKAIKAKPKDARVLGKMAQLESEQGHWSAAERGWTAALQVKESATARINRAICRHHLHHWEDALDDLHRAYDLAPGDPRVQRVGKLFERLASIIDAVRDLDGRVAVAPKDAGLLCDRALIFLRAEDAELALEDSEAATKLAPWAMRPKLFEAIALIQLGRFSEAEKLEVRRSLHVDVLTSEFLQSISRLDADISVERANAELYAQRAWQLNEIGQPALALQDAEFAAQLNGKSAGACAEKSYALKKLGRAAEALDQIKRATDLDPQFATAWQYRGELEMEKSDYNAAIESFSRALALNKSAVILQKREQCYREVGLVAKAEQDHRAVQELIAKALQ
jgi:tetratricopeptide (TPR) repeat protein